MKNFDAVIAVTDRGALASRVLSRAPLPAFLSYGRDLPEGLSPMFWTSGHHAARLTLAGLATFNAPGPAFLEGPARKWTRRTTSSGLLHEVPEGRLFVKALEHKVPGLLAGVWDGTEFQEAARSLGVDPSSRFQWTRDILELDHEHRCFVAHGEVLTLGAYRVGGIVGEMTSPYTPAAREFAQGVVHDLGDDFPPAATLDVARDPERGWVVVETNPAWSSGFYGCDPVLALRAVRAGNQPSERWAWDPDPDLLARARASEPFRLGSDLPGFVEFAPA